MGIIIRQSIWISLFSYVGILLGYLNIIFLFPLYLDTDQIGSVRFIQSTAVLFLPFVQLGLSSTILRYYPVLSRKATELGGFLPFMILAASLFFCVFLGVFLLLEDQIISLFQEKAPEAGNYLRLILVLLFVINLQAVLDAYSRSLLEVVVINVLRDLGLRIFTTAIILTYAQHIFDFETFLYLLVSMYAINVLILLVYLRTNGYLKLGLDFSFWKQVNRREVIAFTLYTFLGSTGSSIFRRIDNFMITSMLGLAFTGIYATMFNIAMVIEVPMFAIAQISQPLIAKAFAENDLKNIQTIYEKSSINQHLVGSLILIGIWANLQNLFDFMPNGSEFSQGYWVVVTIGCAKLIDMASGSNSEILNMSQYYRFNMLLMLMLAFMSAGLNWLLIPMFGMNGAAVATLFTLIFFNMAKMVFIRRKYGIQPLSRKNLWLLLITALVLYLSLTTPRLETPWLDILVRSAAITLVFGSLVLIFRISEDINRLFFQLLRRVKLWK